MVMLDLDVGDAQEPITVAADEERKLRITSCHVTESDKGTFLIPRFEVIDEPFAKEFTSPLRIPTDDLGEKELNRAKWNLKVFFETFEFEVRGEFDPKDDLPGCEGWAILGIRESDDYGEQNTIKRYLPPK